MWIRPVLCAFLAALALFFVSVLAKTPSHHRTWQPHLSRLPTVQEEGSRVTITPYRDWTYSWDAPVRQAWVTLPTWDIHGVRRTWFVVEPHPGLPIMAHTLVLFEFADGALIGLTVEARKEEDETYSALRGTFNAFELIYQWASPRDLLTRRAVMMDRDLYMYPLVLTQDEIEAYLSSLLDKTRAIERRARFYNTANSNCTNELAKSAGLSWHPAFVMTGYSANALYEMGRIAGDGSFEDVRRRARIDGVVREIASLPETEFNAALLQRAEARR